MGNVWTSNSNVWKSNGQCVDIKWAMCGHSNNLSNGEHGSYFQDLMSEVQDLMSGY